MNKDSLKLTRSIEDYLEVMYKLHKTKGVIKVKDIATELNVKPPSVVEAIKKLSEMELVSYEKYGGINLNKKGMEIAESILSKHEVLKNFLGILGIEMEVADEDACAMEHVLDASTINKLKKFTEFVERYPNILGSFRYYEKHGKLPKKSFRKEKHGN